MSTMAVSEQEARVLAARYGELQQAVAVAQDQITMIRGNLAACESSIQTLTGLKEATEKGAAESIVPVGSGCLVYAEVRSVSKVIINVGAGVNIEKSADEAIEFLKNRQERFGKMMQDVNASLTTLGRNMKDIEDKLNSGKN